MELPAGWKQGEPRVMGGFRSTSSGTFFFEDRGKDLPSGSITVFPREGENLKAHVDKVIEQEKAMTGMFKSLTGTLGKMAGGEVEREARKAQEALESEIMSPAEIAIGGGTAYGVAFKTSDVATYRVFVEKGSEVIEIIFQTEAPDFPSYEAAFKAAAATIKIE